MLIMVFTLHSNETSIKYLNLNNNYSLTDIAIVMMPCLYINSNLNLGIIFFIQS